WSPPDDRWATRACPPMSLPPHGPHPIGLHRPPGARRPGRHPRRPPKVHLIPNPA
ncbi:MAG: hypothetical protein AVDCRST_MAG49-3090, partial [uncultured Thermomicrobiales bacterium]